MNDDRTTAEKKRKLYFILTVAEIVIGIAGIAVFVVLCRTAEDIKAYVVALLLALVMIVSGTSSLFKLRKTKKSSRKQMQPTGIKKTGTRYEDRWDKMSVLRRKP